MTVVDAPRGENGRTTESGRRMAEGGGRQAVRHLTPCGTELAVLVCVHELNIDH